MAKIYLKKIKEEQITIENVPPRWKDEVLLLLSDTTTEVK